MLQTTGDRPVPCRTLPHVSPHAGETLSVIGLGWKVMCPAQVYDQVGHVGCDDVDELGWMLRCDHVGLARARVAGILT